jgi:hypothetical protein
MWSIATLLLFYVVAKRIIRSGSIAFLGALCYFATAGFWTSSTQVFPYAAANGSIGLLVGVLISTRDDKLTVPKMVISALLLAVSIFYHQYNVLFCLPLAYYLLVEQKKKICVASLALIPLALTLVLTGYLLVFFFAPRHMPIDGFLRFCFTYVLSRYPTWGTLHNFSLEGITELILSQLRNFVWFYRAGRPTITIFTATLSLLFLVHMRHIVMRKAGSGMRTFLLLWIATYQLFSLWWLPRYDQLLTITLFPIFLLVCITFNDAVDSLLYSRLRKRLAFTIIVVVAIVIFTVNLNKRILPLHRSRGFFYYHASRLHSLAPRDCTIVTHHPTKAHLKYYFDRKDVISIDWAYLYFYQHRPLTPQYLLRGDRSILVSVAYVTPEYAAYAVHCTGYQKPLEWLKIMEWLFAFEYTADHRLRACRNFEVRADDKKRLYLLLTSTTIEVDGLYGLCQMLDSKISESSGEESTAFSAWYSTAYLNANDREKIN